MSENAVMAIVFASGILVPFAVIGIAAIIVVLREDAKEEKEKSNTIGF